MRFSVIASFAISLLVDGKKLLCKYALCVMILFGLLCPQLLSSNGINILSSTQ